MPQVGVIIGSRSDDQYVQGCIQILNDMGIEYEYEVLSAHRTPEQVMAYARSARDRGIQVLIAGAGGSAALPGVLASWTTLPVIGIPLPTSELKGVDSLHTIVQMPPGIPVACVAVGEWGSRNAAYLAAQILGLQDEKIRRAYEAYREKLREGSR